MAHRDIIESIYRAGAGLTPWIDPLNRIAAALVSGLPVKKIARELKVGLSTVRTQLKSVVEKTGTHRQSELMRVLLLAGEF